MDNGIGDSISIIDDSETETEIMEGDFASDFKKSQRKKSLIKRILNLCGEDDEKTRPLHVVIIGPAGAGKSSFVNTIAAALDDSTWREYAYSGSHGETGGQITVFTNSYVKCCKAEKYKHNLLPTLIDVAGFHDQSGEEFIELLRIVFYGRLPVGESLAHAAQYYKQKGLNGLRAKYSENNEKLKVDRVIFLSSATQLVPEQLIQSVIQAARPSEPGSKKRTIPIYGVMLKHDKVVSRAEYDDRTSTANIISEDAYAEREMNFINALGLVGSKHRFLRCSNYCDDVDPDNKRTESVLPDLDIPVLRFLTQVVDPVIEVMNEQETYLDSKKTKVQEDPIEQDRKQNQNTKNRPDQNFGQLVGIMGPNSLCLALASVEAMLIAFILNFVMQSPIDLVKLGVICKINATGTQLDSICSQLKKTGVQQTVWLVIALVMLVGLRLVVAMATKEIYGRPPR